MEQAAPAPAPLTVITTHANADFDAIGSMLAAHKLYPGSLVIFPEFNEKTAKNFFVSAMAYLFNMVHINEIDMSAIRRLIVVDTRQAHRIGEMAAIIDNPDVEIHIYDHHPATKNDIRADRLVTSPTGANVTLLTEMIKDRNIPVTPEEATIMCLGIYEDTGSFTFSSTTERDFTAAAFLVSKGADLSTISSLITKEMDPRQISLLNDMINGAVSHHINGLEVTVACVSCDDYIHDFAFLVQKMMRIESLTALFGIALMKNKIYVSARSQSPEIDVGVIVSELGGGGHKYAAAATIRGKTLAQAETELLAILPRHIKAKNLAESIMSSPAISTEPDTSCKSANELLTRYNVNALLVVDTRGSKNQLLGFISRQVIEKALYHGLTAVPVREYMSSEFAIVGPQANLDEIQRKIIDNKQRVLPVVSGDNIIGVITRTDLLNLLVQESDAQKQQRTIEKQATAHPRTRDITAFMKERLSKQILKLLRHIGEVADQRGVSAYVVGGFVRDLFLYRHNEDIDIVIEGDGIGFAKQFSGLYNARVNSYEKFGTAVIIFPDNFKPEGFKIDVASARMEYYHSPAALPTVEMSSIKMDLLRRDFTINTLAVALNKSAFGSLIDFFSAQRDIKEKVIRILHNLSFVEDPTRVFRAIRFEQRFGFTIGKLTSGLIENAVKMDFFKNLAGCRVFSELRHILEEENPTPYLVRLNDYKLLKRIDPSFVLNRKLIFHFNAAKKVISWFDLLFTGEPCIRWRVYFLVLLRHQDKKSAESVCRRLELAPKHKKFFVKDRLLAEERLNRLHQNLPTAFSHIYRELKDLKIELILYIMAITTHTQLIKHISYYVTDLRHMKLSVSGKDIQALGIDPSPVYGKILSAVMDAKLNGEVVTRNQELELLKNHVEKL